MQPRGSLSHPHEGGGSPRHKTTLSREECLLASVHVHHLVKSPTRTCKSSTRARSRPLPSQRVHLGWRHNGFLRVWNSIREIVCRRRTSSTSSTSRTGGTLHQVRWRIR